MSYDVVILPSFAEAEAWQKRHAEKQASGLFAQVVTTFDAWIADLWELHGDGRALVGDMQRAILMSAVLAQELGEATPTGLASLASSCMRAAAGVSQFEDALAAARAGERVAHASDEELAFLHALAAYEDALAFSGFVEQGAAAALIAQREETVFPRPLRVLMPDTPPLTWVQEQFFASCSQLNATYQIAAGAEGVSRAPEGVDVRFAFPSGRLAQPGLIADEVLAHASAGDVVVVCKDPLAMLSSVQDRLVAQGLHVCAQARKPFAQTDFGCAFLAMRRLLAEVPWDGAALADVLISPFSGLLRTDAFKADAAVRANRLASREDVLADLRARSEQFSYLEELAGDPEADVLISAFEQMVQAMAHRSPAWRTEQLTAMKALREATSSARKIGSGIDDCVVALTHASIPVSVQAAGVGSQVLITTQPVAARMQPGCCQALIVADLTSEDYPVADRDDAASTLMAKLGLPPRESALSRARREFYALCNLPVQTMVVMRPLGNDAADSTYPSAVLEEFIDAYRGDPSATDDIDNAYRLPADLQAGLVERGEELLFANGVALDGWAMQAQAATISVPHLEDIDEQAVSSIVSRRHDSAGNELARPCLAPSQIEAYLECPYRWFATRRMRIEGLDEGFGPLERGSFAHEVLEVFYRRFQEMGYAKVSGGNIEYARALMRETLDELVVAQFDKKPGERLVYVTELERREVEALCNQLVAFLDIEAAFLPTFHPAYFEYSIGPDDAVSYGDNLIIGKVDRIDVDDAGHAVIVDYKGSLNSSYEIAGKDWAHPGKVQTRIYAQAVKRALQLNVVGALYVSYGRRPAISGAYDSRVLESAHLPATRHDSCACGTFDAIPDPLPEGFSFADLSFSSMLDATEALASEAVGRLCAGDVAPNPTHADVCAFCPVLACPKRGA